jgi:hypothetical protein
MTSVCVSRKAMARENHRAPGARSTTPLTILPSSRVSMSGVSRDVLLSCHSTPSAVQNLMYRNLSAKLVNGQVNAHYFGAACSWGGRVLARNRGGHVSSTRRGAPLAPQGGLSLCRYWQEIPLTKPRVPRATAAPLRPCDSQDPSLVRPTLQASDAREAHEET